MMIVQVHHNRVLGDCKTQCRRPFKVRLCSKKKSIGKFYILQPQKKITNQISSTEKLFYGEFSKKIKKKNHHSILIVFDITQKPQRSLDRRKANIFKY